MDTSRRSHAHQVLLSRDGRFLLALDLGLDRIFVYRFDPVAGALSANEPAAFELPRGYGPRHAAFSRDGATLYVLAELTAKLITLRWNEADGTLVQLAETSVLPPGYTGMARSAELALSPDGRFLYASNRTPSNSIAAFRLQRGRLAEAHQCGRLGRQHAALHRDRSQRPVLGGGESGFGLAGGVSHRTAQRRFVAAAAATLMSSHWVDVLFAAPLLR